MNTVALQEASNNFTHLEQYIKDKPIASVVYGPNPPEELGITPTREGELYIQINDGEESNKVRIWVSVPQGVITFIWEELITNIDTTNVSLLNQPNEYDDLNQTIRGSQIITVKSYTADYPSSSPDFEGQIAICRTTDDLPAFYVAFKDNTDILIWKSIESTGAGELPETVVKTDKANNFTELDQTINDRPIAAIIYGPNPADTAGISPSRVGEMYVQIPEGSENRKLRVWMSIATAPTTFIWEELANTGLSELPETVVQTNKENNFTELTQSISGNRIMTFVNGGTQNPGESGIRPQFEGQFYIAFKTLESGPDVAVWIGYGNSWLPIIKPSVDVSQFAKLNESNVFTDLVQMIGPAEDGRLIGGTRIKRGSTSPIADASWVAKIEGEQTIFVNTSTTPAQISIWTAVSTTGTNINDWKMTWSTNGGHVDLSNVAKVNEENTFVPLQKIGVENNTAFIHTSRKGSYDPSDVASPDILPYSEGELYVQEYLDGGAVEHKIWIATAEGDTDSWICIYDSTESTVSLAAKIVELEAYDDVLDAKLLVLDKDTDDMAKTIGLIDSDVTALETDLGLEKDKIVNLDTRVNANELKIAALESHHGTNQETFTAHDTRIDALEVETAKLPTTPTANTYLIVNADGTAYTTSTETVTDVQGMAALAEGVVSGDALINVKSLGGDTALTSGNVSQSSFSVSNIVFGTPESSVTRTVSMGNIQPYTSTDLAATDVREGCRITVVNKGSGTLTLSPPSGTKIFAGSSSLTTMSIPSQCAVELFPAIYDDGSKKYITTGYYLVNHQPAKQSDITSIQSSIATINGSINTHGGEIDALETLTASHTSTIASHTQSISNITSELATANGYILTLQTMSGTAERDIEALETRMTTVEALETRIAELERIINGLSVYTLKVN